MLTYLDDSLVLLPHLPDWSEPPTPSRKWQTGVATGLTLAEDRQAVRQTPLQSLTWTVTPFDQRENEQLAAAVRAAKKAGNAATPWWGRGYKLGVAGVIPTDTIIPISAFVPSDWLPSVGDKLWAGFTWPTAGGVVWELWTVAAVTPGIAGAEHTIEIEEPTALTIPGGTVAVWRLLIGTFTAEEINYDRPTAGKYRLTVTEPRGINPGISMSPAVVYWGRMGPEDSSSFSGIPNWWLDPALVMLTPLPSVETVGSIARPGGYSFTTLYGTTLQESTITPAESVRGVAWTHGQDFPQFDDPVVGKLQEVVLEVENLIRSQVSAENLDSSPHTLTVGSDSNITVKDASLTVLLSVDTTVSQSTAVTAYDGVTDFAGPGGSPGSGFIIDPPLSAAHTETVTLDSGDGATFAQFIGTGTITLTLFATGSEIATGSPSIARHIITETGAQITFTYRYRKNEGYFWLAFPDWTGEAPRPGDGAKLVSTGAIFPLATASDLAVSTSINGYGYSLQDNGSGVIYRMFRSKYPVYSGDDDAVLITL